MRVQMGETSKLQLRSLSIKLENCIFYVDTKQRMYLSSGNTYSDSTLMLGLVSVEFF
jgi:hypothetical protein